jgi:prepilin-type processing-associated H-X9-DG protein
MYYGAIYTSYGMTDFGGDGSGNTAITLDLEGNSYSGNPFDGSGNGGSNSIHNLRQGIERFLITDINNPAGSAQAASTIWVLADVVSSRVSEFNHIPGGCNVLYLDGHVEYVRYTEEQPVTEGVALFHSKVNNI